MELFFLGLVDAHTHPVWAGDRVHEFALKVGTVRFIYFRLVHPFKSIPLSTLRTKTSWEREDGQHNTDDITHQVMICL